MYRFNKSLIMHAVLSSLCFVLFSCVNVPGNTTESETIDLVSKKEYSQRVMTAVDLLEMEKISGQKISPDGRYLSYFINKTDWAKNDTLKQSVFYDLTTQKKLDIKNVKSKNGYFDSVYWAPDGAGFITYFKQNADKEADKKAVKQFYYYKLGDQSLTQLSDFSTENNKAQSIRWAPDNQGFYFLNKEARTAKKAWEYDEKWRLKEYETRDKKEIQYFDLSTQEISAVTNSQLHIISYELSDDGESILYTSSPTGVLGDRQLGELWLYDLITKQTTKLTDNNYAEYAAKLAPDKKSLVYRARVNAKGEGYYQDNLFIQDVDTKKARLLLADQSFEVNDLAWSKDSKYLFIRANTGLSSSVYQYDLENKRLKNLTGQKQQDIMAWSYVKEYDLHLFKITDANSPGDLFIQKTAQQSAQQLTHLHDELKNRFYLPKQQAYRWQASDGYFLEGLLVFPVNYVEGETFPLVTITHGGPRSAVHYGSWNTSRYVAVLAGQGYGVFLPNHRGGTGYGDEFMRSMVGNYWRHAHTDVMSGIDALISQGYADPERLIKQGWSAGGHMANKLITYTNRFKAASSGAGAADWVSMYGESDVRSSRTPWFGGAPWEKEAPLDNYLDQSPLKDAWKVKTPTLFWVGEKDVRVPPTQSILMYRGVKAAGTRTELYIAPGEPHNFKKPRHNLFKTNTELAWYAKHLSGQSYDPVFPEYVNQHRPGN